MEYTTENGDTVEARGLTLKVELGERTKNEILSQAMARMQEATETIERLLQALVEADAENAKLKQLVRHMYTCIEHADDVNGCTGCPLDDTSDCDFEGRMIALGIEAD